MITKNEFKKNEIYIYSDFGVSSYAVIKAIEVYKVKGKNFWFKAMIVDNSNLDGKNYEWNANGQIKSFSNSFIYKSLRDLKSGNEAYKKVQIQFLKSLQA